MKVLVTGGAGFIGSNLCERLLLESEIDEVCVIDDLSTGFKSNLTGMDAVSFVEASILDADALNEAARGCRAIVHLAALGSVPRSVQDPVASHHANATGTLQVLEAARNAGNAHVVLASSSSVYGANPTLPKSEDLQCLPVSPYAVSKLAAEQYAMAFAKCYELPVLPFRFFNVYGPRQMPGHAYAAVVPAFLEAALSGRPLQVNGDGEQSRDFTFVETVTTVLARAVVGGFTSGPMNLAFGTRTSLNTVIGLLEELLERPLAIDRRPTRHGDVKHSQAANALLREKFPEIAPVPLREGLERTANWMRRHLTIDL